MPKLGSSADIWMQKDHIFTRFVDFPALIRCAADPAVQAIVITADSIDGTWSEVRPRLQQMLSDVVALGDTVQGWSARYPTIPRSSAERAAVEKLRKLAILACERAQNQVALAVNEFKVFTDQSFEYQQQLSRQIQRTEAEKAEQQASADREKCDLTPPPSVVAAGSEAIAAWTAAQTALINDRLKAALARLNDSIVQFAFMRQNGLDMTQSVNRNLAEVNNILSGPLLEDPELYAEIVQLRWSQVGADARQVLQIVNLGTHPAAAPVRIGTIPASLSDKDLIMKAVSPSSTLGTGIKTQAASAQEVFTKMDQLLISPYLKDIVGYWDETKTERNTLFDVLTSLRTEYVQMMAMEYSTIQNISSLAILQAYRARSVADGNLSLENFIQFTSQSVRAALTVAQGTSGRFGSAAERFQFVLGVIDQNVDDITKQISGLDTNIASANKQLRDKIIWVIADTIALAFATAAVLVAFGVVGPVGATLTAAAQIGASAGLTAASIKFVLDSLSLDDIVQTIEPLKALRNTLSASVNELTTVRPLFGDVVNGVNGLTGTITDMQLTLTNVLNNLDTLGSISFTSRDANAIKDAWAQVQQDAQTWMDIINIQGISPITMSLKDSKA